MNVPLEPLETKSEIHSTLDLLDEKGRKPVGGKLEIFVRLREPLTGVRYLEWLGTYRCASFRICILVGKYVGVLILL